MAEDKEMHGPEHEEHHKSDEVSGKEDVPPREAMEEAAEAGAEHHPGREQDEKLEHEAMDRAAWRGRRASPRGR